MGALSRQTLTQTDQAVEPGWLPHQLAMIAATADPATAAVLLQAASELRRLYMDEEKQEWK